MVSYGSSYRPHNPGHDYYAPGVYLITLVVRNREHNHSLFGTLNNDVKAPAVVLSEIGKAVMDCWHLIPEIQARHGRKVNVHGAVCMPDHFHGVIEVLEPMDRSVGEVIRSFKSGCTIAWQKQKEAQNERPKLVAHEDKAYIARLSKRQRAEYYAAHPEACHPLWDDNYDDTICLRDESGNIDMRHFSAMIRYVEDNPRALLFATLAPSSCADASTW